MLVSGAVVAKAHRLYGWKQQQFILPRLRKSGCRQGPAPSALQRSPFTPRPSLLSAVALWLRGSASVSTWPPLLESQSALLARTDTGHGAAPALIHQDLILTGLRLQRPYFQLRLYSQVPGVRT